MPIASALKGHESGHTEFGDDPRWQLMMRVLQSAHFAKSSRLCGFLRFITEETLSGREDLLNEQRIGIHVFERKVDYDSADDNIVRSHASRLRQRLEAYFQTDGKSEQLRIELRRGSYIPVFEPVSCPENAVRETSIAFYADAQPAQETTRTPAKTYTTYLPWALVICLVLSLAVSVKQWIHYRQLANANRSESPLVREFGGQIFLPGKRNLMVPADSSLVLFENLTGKPISLQDYMSRDYLSGAPTPSSLHLEASAKWIGRRRLTSVADIELTTSLLRIPEVASAQPQIRFARDLQLADLKEANLILIGAEESDPWLSIFQPNLNFVISNDQRTTVFTVLNRSPKAKERATYQYDPRDPNSSAYALIALRPNLSGNGRIVIVEGTGIAGTEAAADFLVDHVQLEKIIGPIVDNLGRVPSFEILLETTNLNGSAPRSKVVAVRFDS